MISIVLPTIDGREHWVERWQTAYRYSMAGKHTVHHEVITIRNRPTCGLAWQEGIDQASGEYIHLSADDLIPHPGWWEAAVKTTNAGYLPAPVIYNPDGSLQTCGEGTTLLPHGTVTGFTRVPFGSREQFEAIGPMFTGHYYTDNWVSHRGRLCGYPTAVSAGYVFTHHWAKEGRVDERFGPDGEEYARWIAA